MDRFKKVAIKKHAEQIIDDLYHFEEAPDLVNQTDLDLSKINVYLHQILNLVGTKAFRVKTYYGRIAEDGSFQAIEERFNDEELFSDISINRFYDFEYLPNYNHLKSTSSCDVIIDLKELNANRFLKKQYQMRNEQLTESPDSFRQPFTVFVVSFFLQTHTAEQLEVFMQKRNEAMSQFIASIKRKLPDRVDIFNKKNETEFVALMKGDFKRIIAEERQALECFLPSEIARNTINDNFNFTEEDGSDFGNISLENFLYLTKQCFFQDWLPHMEAIYRTFVKVLPADDDAPLDTVRQDSTGVVKKSSQMPFSLRNFLVSLVLMSHCTVSEKFDVLYDLFDWNDGVADGLDMNALFLLVKTLFERNLYYWPSHELFNLVEMAFDLSVASVYQVLWTSVKDLANVHLLAGHTIMLSDLLQNPQQPQKVAAVDVTEEVQETLNSYQRMFGTKIVDFNRDSSAFKSIGTLIRGGEHMLEATNRQGSQFRLVIFYQVSSERYQFEVGYDRQGQLLKYRDMVEKDDIDEYLKRNINKLYLQGRSKGIGKQEFLTKTVQIPFLHDLVRVETLYRDRLKSSLQKKKRLAQELVVLLNEGEYQFVFRFQAKVMHNVEGDLHRLDPHTFRILMGAAHEQDVVSDLRERIIAVIKRMVTSETDLAANLDSEFMLQAQGARDFFVREVPSKWCIAREFDRLGQFAQGSADSEVIMKLERSRHQGGDDQLGAREEERDLAAFDCYSLYKHCDMSYEWRLCKIMQKEPILAQNQGEMISMQQLQQQAKSYHYWIEFLHHRKTGQKLWLKRRREDILMSARYAREQQRNYEQESLRFVREIYRDAFAY